MVRKSVASLLLACICIALTIAIPARAQTATVFEGARLITGDGQRRSRTPRSSSKATASPPSAAAAKSARPRARRASISPARPSSPRLIDAHSHIGYMRNLTSGPQNYTRENILDHMHRFAYFGVAASMAMGSDFGELPFTLRDETAAGKLPERRAVPDRRPRPGADRRDQPEQHAPRGVPDHDRRRRPARGAGARVRTTSR